MAQGTATYCARPGGRDPRLQRRRAHGRRQTRSIRRRSAHAAERPARRRGSALHPRRCALSSPTARSTIEALPAHYRRAAKALLVAALGGLARANALVR